MNIFNIRKDVRVRKSVIMRLIARGIVDKNMIRGGGNYIVFSGITFAYTKRINSICDIEVYSGNEWVFVRHMDTQTLEKIYKTEEKPVIVNKEPEPVEEKKEEAIIEPVVEIEEVVDTTIEEPEPEDEAEEEPPQETVPGR